LYLNIETGSNEVIYIGYLDFKFEGSFYYSLHSISI
jgi:hypothetical protein